MTNPIEDRPLEIKIWNKHAHRGMSVFVVDPDALDDGIVECEIVKAYRDSSGPTEKVCIWMIERVDLTAPKVNSCIAQAYFLDSTMRDSWAQSVFFREKKAKEAYRYYRREQAALEDQRIQRLEDQIAELIAQKNKILDRITKDIDT